MMVDKLTEKDKESRERIKYLDSENKFYHKLNYLLDTMRQVHETEKGLLQKLTRATKRGDPQEKINQCETGIAKC